MAAVLLLILTALVALQQMQALMLHLYSKRCNFNRQLLCEAIHFSRSFIFQGHVGGQRSARKFWVRPGRTTVWWDGFAKGIVVEEEWKENFRMSWVNFLSSTMNFVYLSLRA